MTSAVIDQLMVKTREALGVTSIVITHDMRSAYTVGDRIAMLYKGQVRSVGTVDEVRSSADPVLRTDLLGPVSLLTRAAQRLEAQGSGCIAALSSVAGDRGRGSNLVYGAAKAGLTAFLSGLRNRLSGAGVRVVTVKPGFVDTPMTDHLPKNPLYASPERVARDVVRAIDTGADVVYTPWWWRFVMLAVRLIPERLFKRLSL